MLSNCVRRAASRVSAPLARQYSSIIARPTCSQLVASNRLTNSNQKTAASFSSFTGKHEVYGTRVVYELGGKPKAPTHSPAEIEKLVLSTIQSFDRFPEGKTGGIVGVNHLPALSANLTIHKTQIRHFGDKPPLSQKTVGDRIMLVLRLYDKIDANKVVEVVLTMDTHLMNDLGLDSLDHVEIIMAIEDEFTTEIPDGDAENLMTPRQIYQYICDVEDVIE